MSKHKINEMFGQPKTLDSALAYCEMVDNATYGDPSDSIGIMVACMMAYNASVYLKDDQLATAIAIAINNSPDERVNKETLDIVITALEETMEVTA